MPSHNAGETMHPKIVPKSEGLTYTYELVRIRPKHMLCCPVNKKNFILKKRNRKNITRDSFPNTFLWFTLSSQHTSAGRVSVAIKALKEGSSTLQRKKFLQEAAIMGQFKHRNVVNLLGVVVHGEPVSRGKTNLNFSESESFRILLPNPNPNPNLTTPSKIYLDHV